LSPNVFRIDFLENGSESREIEIVMERVLEEEEAFPSTRHTDEHVWNIATSKRFMSCHIA
jgi:hypothetical protein